MTVTVKPIRTEQDYNEAVKRINELINAKPNTPEEAELDVLTDLVWAYEEEHYPMPLPDPIEAIKFEMDQKGLKEIDLCPYIGSESEVFDILSGKRKLTIDMIKKLHRGLGIPLESLIGE